MCYNALLKKKEGRNMDENAVKGRRYLLETDREEPSKEKAEEKHAEALQKWEDHTKNEKQEREKDLLELCPSEIISDAESSRKKRKYAIKTIQKAKYRQHTFYFLTKNFGKRVKNSLKRVKVVKKQNEVVKECQDRRSIEHEASEHNKNILEKLMHQMLLKIEHKVN